MLYNIALVSAIYQHESVIGIHVSLPLEPPSLLPPYPTSLGCHRALDLSCLHHTANFHWPSHFSLGNVFISGLLSPFVPHFPLIPPSSFRAVSTNLFSMSLFPLLPWGQVWIIFFCWTSASLGEVIHWLRLYILALFLSHWALHEG